MNNNKKFLKRSVAAFLAALNIFNFSGGSSKAIILDEFIKSIDEIIETEKPDYDVIQKYTSIIHKIMLLANVGIEKIDFEKEYSEIEESNNKVIIDKKKDYKFAKVYDIQLQNDIYLKKIVHIIAKCLLIDNISDDNWQSEYNKFLKREKREEVVIYKFSSNLSEENKEKIIQYFNNDDFKETLFINLEDIKNLDNKTLNFEKKELKPNNFVGVYWLFRSVIISKKLTQQNKNLIEENKKLKKENDENAKYFYMHKVLINLFKTLKEHVQKLKEGSSSLAKVQGDIEFENVKFKLISDNAQNTKFLGNVKFKYGKNEETFSINELIDKLNKELKSRSENKFEKLEPINPNEFTKIAYEKKLQEYIDTLNRIIELVRSMTGRCEEFEQEIECLKGYNEILEENVNQCNDLAKKILGQFHKGLEFDNTLERNLDSISTEVNTLNKKNRKLSENLEKANSRAKKLGIVTGLGWIGTFVSLGCIFQNELRNACSTVCKKVSELKNSILG